MNSDPLPTKENPKPKRTFKLRFFTDYDKDLILHWGIGRKSGYEWTYPDEAIWPANSKCFDSAKSAVQTHFSNDGTETGYNSIAMTIEADNMEIKGISYVVFDPNTNQWYNNSGMNYNIDFGQQPIHLDNSLFKGSSVMTNLIKEIIMCETVYGSWTLMHRYNKCDEIINKINIESPEDVYDL